jgi:hypothetical protein
MGLLAWAVVTALLYLLSLLTSNKPNYEATEALGFSIFCCLLLFLLLGFLALISIAVWH